MLFRSGVVGTITVRNLGRLKKVLSQLSDQAAGFRGLYQRGRARRPFRSGSDDRVRRDGC